MIAWSRNRHAAGAQLAVDAVAVAEGGLQAIELLGVVRHGSALLAGAPQRWDLASELALTAPSLARDHGGPAGRRLPLKTRGGAAAGGAAFGRFAARTLEAADVVGLLRFGVAADGATTPLGTGCQLPAFHWGTRQAFSRNHASNPTIEAACTAYRHCCSQAVRGSRTSLSLMLDRAPPKRPQMVFPIHSKMQSCWLSV